MRKTLALILSLCLLLGTTAITMAEQPAEATYTYNFAVSSFPTNWSTFQNQTATDNDILDFLGSGLYSFDYNETMDGYKVVPLAAADFPVDVTDEYVGEDWGIAEYVADPVTGEPTEEKATARAWKVTIREDLQWSDGTPITAKDFETSARLRLDPRAQNHRADSFYTGNMVITNAEAYAKQGVPADTSLTDYMSISDIEDIDAWLEANGELKGYVDWNNSFGDTYDFEAKAWTGAAEGGVVETPLTIKELYEFYTTGEGGTYITWADDETKKEWALDELFAKYTWPEMAWENVGFKAVGDYDFVLILTKPLTGFYLHYAMTDSWLVKEDLYLASESETDGVYNNSYGTTVETTASWGPYVLETFQSDKIYTLVRNEKWFGFNEPERFPYQTTKIQCDFVSEPATRLEMFLNGQLDTYGLQRDDMETYAKSEYTYYNEGDSVFAMVFNPNLEAMTANQAAAGENINKTILTVKDFRVAMSLAMNRQEFVLATSPVNAPAFALYGSQIVANPEEGIFYRNTEEAQKVVVRFWGLEEEIGEGKLYATVEDAIDSISGYNLEMAREYFDKAYDEAMSLGLMKEGDVVSIMVGTPNNTSAFYNNGYDYIVNNYTEAVKGTKLEGKLEFSRDATLGNGFADALRTNKVDMLFGVGWTGSTFDPYGLMEAYVKESYQYDSAWNTQEAIMEMELDGVKYSGTVYDWYLAMSGETKAFTNVDTKESVNLNFAYSTDSEKTARRIYVLSQMEDRVLQNYNFIPLMNASSANLKGMQIKYYTEDEMFPMGRGGLRFQTYNYNDAEWDAFVAEQGGTLNYK